MGLSAGIHTVVTVSIVVDIVGIIGCLWMLIDIFAYKVWNTTRDRIIVALNLITLTFLAFGALPEHAVTLDRDTLAYSSTWIVFMVYTFWWMMLLIETVLLAYLLHIIRGVQPGGQVKAGRVSLEFEIFVGVCVFLASVTIGALVTVDRDEYCSSETVQYGENYPESCVKHIEIASWSWISFLSIPFTMQVVLSYYVLRAKKVIRLWRQQGQSRAQSSIVEALGRVMTNIIKPLQWYPALFMVFAIIYVIWALSLYTDVKDSQWAHKIGPASNLVFSLKGVSIPVVYFLCTNFSAREKPLCTQLVLRFQQLCGGSTYAPTLEERLVGAELGADASYANNSWGSYDAQSNELYGESISLGRSMDEQTGAIPMTSETSQDYSVLHDAFVSKEN